MRTAVAAITIASLALIGTGLTGCTGENGSPARTTPHATATTTIPAAPTGVGMIRAVTMATATKRAGTTVRAAGTVKGPVGVHGDIVISVSWVDAATATVYARGLTRIRDLAPGDRRHWTVSAQLPKGAAKVAVVLGAVVPATHK